MTSTTRKSNCGLFGRQLLSTLKLHVLQRIHSPISTIVEILVPIIFIVGVVILSLVIKNEEFEGQDFLNYDETKFALEAQKLTLSSLCYNETVTGRPIDGITPCAAATGTVHCYGTADGLPMNGICINVGKSSDVILGGVSVLITSYGSRMMPVPSFDDMVKLQWVVKCMEALLGSVIFSNGISHSGWLYVSPRNAYTEALVSHLNTSTSLFKYVFVRYFNSIKEGDDYLHSRDDPVSTWGTIHVNSVSKDTGNPFLDVAIRLNSSSLPSTISKVDLHYPGGSTEYASKYFLSGFITLQTEVYNHFITGGLQLQSPPVPLVVSMGTTDYTEQSFLTTAGSLVPLLVVLGFLYPVSLGTKRIVLDKELRIKEALLIMGLQQTVQYLAWFIIATIQYTTISLVCALLLRFTCLKQSNFGAVFFLFLLFSLTTVALSGLIASLFSKSRLASIVAPLVYFVLSAPLFALGSVSGTAISALCILSPSAFARGLTIVFDYEISHGFSSRDFQSAADQPNMAFIFGAMVFDLVLYLLIMLYLDAVVPNDWGTPMHPLFCITSLLPCCRKKKDLSGDEDGRNPNGVFEPLTDEEQSNATVRICGLTKRFKRGGEKFYAVNKLNLDLIEGEISVLLGHNGAGKSTTMNMMTGMLKSDSGDCYIYGHSISDDLRGARQEIGYCPQHNILWPELTCYEHLEYFSSIKGLSGESQQKAIDTMLDGVDLQEKRNCASSALSGGQKRKLSVAIAFVGNSRLVFLDEPTAGMDVGARRHTWDLLRTMSVEHTIVLSTHFMDEADLLGDRIAIMSKGRLQCAGTSAFLKSNLGVGYNITMSVTDTSNSKAIGSLIRSHVPSAELLSCSAGEISYRLPMSYVKEFSPMLRSIENNGDIYGVQNYTISATTLEEIFLRIAHEDDTSLLQAHDGNTVSDGKPKKKSEKNNNNNNNNKGGREGSSEEEQQQQQHITMGVDVPMSECLYSTNENTPAGSLPTLHSIWDAELITKESTLMGSQFKASLLKRWRNSLRDRRTIFIQIIFPVLMLIFAMLLNMIDFISHPTLLISSDMYGERVQLDLASCDNTFDLSVPFASEVTTVAHNGIGNPQEFSQHLIDTYKAHEFPRYSGIACKDPMFTGSTVLFFNMSSLHATAISLVEYYGAKVKSLLPAATIKYQEDVFRTHNFPLASTKHEEAFRDVMKAMLMSILVMIPFSFIPSTFVAWIVKERECKARHLQNVSGLRFSIYWLSNYLFDFCSYLITMILVIIVMLIFRRKEYVSGDTIGPTLILLTMYGLSCIVMSYALSFLFKEHSTAQNVVLLGNFITGFLLTLLVIILVMLPPTHRAGETMKWIFRIVPSYCVGEGIVNLASLPGVQDRSASYTSPWGLDVVGYPIIYMCVEIPIFLLITLFLDHPARHMRMEMLLHRRNEIPDEISDEEDDVAEERRRVMQTDPMEDQDLVRVENLRKVFGNDKVAVRNLSFGVKPGEVFGFLGTNGAGKTTTISILCQEMVPTSGRAFIHGKDIVQDSREALHYIGYCPQFDALIDLLTVKEHLSLYAGIRGLKPEQREKAITDLMSLCELTMYSKTRAGQLSGGNKRKLSVAIALIGGPRVVFLDEPSAGMDPVARRGLWKAIQSISATCSVVLTTHHLEEVEALAHRVAIMVNGSLRCLGNKTHLKRKYGSGFEMTIRTEEGVARKDVEDFITRCFPEAKLDEARNHRYTYELPPDTVLSEAFGMLEEHKEEVGIADYSVSQTSIEQVFLRISEQAERKDNGDE